jgi:hypothetical protein
MPWIKTGDGEEFRFPEPRLVTNGPLPPGVTERDPAAHAQRRREREESWRWFCRVIVEWYEVYRYCPRQNCRRNGACMSPTVICHEEAKELIEEIVYPKLRAVIHKYEAEGGAAGGTEAALAEAVNAAGGEAIFRRQPDRRRQPGQKAKTSTAPRSGRETAGTSGTAIGKRRPE